MTVVKFETTFAIAALGLSIMFVVLILSLYNFLIGPEGEGPERVVDPAALVLQEVSISGAPCLVLSGIVFAAAKSTGDRAAGALLIGAGVIMMVGMAYATTLLPKIDDQYVVGGIEPVPYIFIVAGAGVTAVGGRLLVVKSRPVRNQDGFA
jgi:hypothetical protein